MKQQQGSSHSRDPQQCVWRWLAVLVAAVALAGCQGTKGNAQDPAHAIPVKVLAVQPTTVEDSSEYVATLKSRNSVTVQPEVEGQITRIFVKSGDRVSAGAPLLQIDPLKQRATVHSQEATRKAKEASLEWARVQLERTRKLYAEGVASRQELDQAQTSFDAAQAELSSIEAQVREQQVQLKYYSVVAPTAGVVGDVPVHVGDRVTTSTVLTTVDQNTGLEAYISVPAERAPQLRLGIPVRILDATGNGVADSRVTFISPQVDTGTQSVLIKSAIERPRADVRALQFVRARVIWSSHPGLTVPLVAVSRVGGLYFAFIAEPQGDKLVARQRPLRLGPIQGNDYVVLEGLKPGDRVIVSGSQNLADGFPVAAEAPGAR